MAARLEWNGDALFVGREVWAQVAERSGGWAAYLEGAYGPLHRDTYERREDAEQDLESEVRRLLKEAGIEVEP